MTTETPCIIERTPRRVQSVLAPPRICRAIRFVRQGPRPESPGGAAYRFATGVMDAS